MCAFTSPAITQVGGCSRINAARRFTKNSAEYLWNRTRTKAGVGYRLHDLRHFFASGLIAAGCDVVTVQRAMGHSAASFTLNTYSHLWPKAEDRTRNAAAQMLAEALTADQVRTGSQ